MMPPNVSLPARLRHAVQQQLRRALFATLALLCAAAPLQAQQALDARLIRYPDVSDSQIVFSYADDLWLLPRGGGAARRLSAGAGEERAKFSPDGLTLAYSAQRDGQNQAYVLPVSGGVPLRITQHPARSQVVDWTPDGQAVLIASTMTSERPNFNQLFKVPRTGGLPQRLPMPFAESAAYSPDGQRLIYTIHRDFQEEVWKRYRGGRAPKLWFHDFSSGASRRLTDGDSPDSEPMWVGGQVYFLSERGPEQRTNLWSLNLDSGVYRQITHFKDHDLKYPSLGPKDIVFTVAGQLYLLDLKSEAYQPVEVTMASERIGLARQRKNVADQLAAYDLSADGTLLSVEARGELFTHEASTQLTLNLTQSPQAAERFPSLAPDGKRLAYVSDESGEYQLYVKDLANQAVRRLTDFAKGMRYKPQWSPDGKQIAFIDYQGDLYLIDPQSGQRRVVMRTLQIHDGDQQQDLKAFRVGWSPDSRWIAFSSALKNRNQALFLFDTRAGGKLSQLTSGYYSDYAPVFGPDGDYLFCLSRRRYEAVNGDIDDVWTYANSTSISAISLRRELPSLADLGQLARRPAATKPASQRPVEIEIDGFETRLVNLPPDDGNIEALAVSGDKLLYLAKPRSGAAGARHGVVKRYRLADQKQDTVVAQADEMLLSADGRQLLVKQGGKLMRRKLAADAGPAEELLLTGLTMLVDPAQEYPQMLREAWRYQRDFFYDPGLHGRDWDGVWTSYASLLPFVQTDSDMAFLLRELCAELGAGHVVASATPRRPVVNTAQIGLLGADLALENGAYRIKRILVPGPRAAELRSPLAAPGVNVQEGEYLLAVNGQPLSPGEDPFGAFTGLADKLVQLRIGSSPDPKTGRLVWVRCLADEQKLRELVWVEHNRREVERLSGGRIGYLYLPDTGPNGQNELMRQYRAQHDKAALLVDERFNRGGALGDRLIELLNRPALAYFNARNLADYPLPTVGHTGPKALLTNGWSYSGGDGFPLLFRNAKLGPLIGSRTWGGLIGPNLFLPLLNGGLISAPPQRVYDPDGRWSGGNVGVAPDILVETDPGALMRGHDPHLQRGVEVLLQALKTTPPAPRTPVPTP